MDDAKYQLFYNIASGLVFLFLGSAWGRSTWWDVTIKFLFFMLVGMDLFLTLLATGFVVAV